MEPTVFRRSIFALLILCLGTNSVLAGVLPGDILVVDYTAAESGAVYLLRPPLCSETVLSSGQYFQDPIDIICDATHRIFVADGSASAIIEIDPDNGDQSLVSLGGLLASPVGLAPGTGDELWVCDVSAVALIQIDKNTGTQQLIHSGPPLVSPFGIARDRFGDIFVVDRSATGSGAMFRLDENTLTLISSGQMFTRPHDIAIRQGEPILPGTDPAAIYVVDASGGMIIAVDPNLPANANQTVIAAGPTLVQPTGLSAEAMFPQSCLYIADLGARAVFSFDLNTGVIVEICPNLSILTPIRVAVCPEGPVQNAATSWGAVKNQFR